MPAQQQGKRYIAPKAIKNHPAVLECEDGSLDSDYRHDVFLREGFWFTRGRNAGCRGGRFNSAREFLAAEPKCKSCGGKGWVPGEADVAEVANCPVCETCSQCDGRKYYFRLPAGVNPFEAGAFAAAQASQRIECSCAESRP